MAASDNKLLFIIIGALIFFLASMLVLPNAWLLVTGQDRIALWHIPFFLFAWGVGGWIPGRRVPRHGVVCGFLAGLMGSFFVASLTFVSPVNVDHIVPLAILAGVGTLLASAGGWLGGVSAREPL